ncbi:MAG TPA: nuclear transport factor 2 family protein [Actinocrinis sp.]|nr:nuclear transport factor 2 family protein [Actinocrinis sp.]
MPAPHTPVPVASPADPATPSEVFERLIGLISAGEWSRIPELYAPDAVAEIVFTPSPPRFVHGREELRERFSALETPGALQLRAENIRVHTTGDPEVVIAEFDYAGRYPSTGRTFRAANIQVLRIRNGLIIETRDFHDHLAMAAAGGNIRSLLSRLDQGASSAEDPEIPAA